MKKGKEKSMQADLSERKPPQSEIVYRMLLDRITSMEYAPGEALNEVDLVKSLGTGRTPVREAIQRLVQVGLVVTKPYQPATVVPLNPPEVAQIVELRIVLETASVRLAAMRADADLKDEIRAFNDAYNRAVRSNDPVRIIESDSQFHQAISRATANPHLEKAVSWNRNFNCRLWHLAVKRGDDFNTKLGAHDAIVDAIDRNDPDAAEQAMRQHIHLFRKGLARIVSGA